MVAEGVTALHPVLSLNHWSSVLRRAEEVSLPVAIEEEQVPERRAFPGELKVGRVPGCAMQNKVGEDTLLLLPEVLGGLPDELGCHAPLRLSFDAVVDPAADVVEADLAHPVGQSAGQVQTPLGALLQVSGILRLAGFPQSLCLGLKVVVASRQVPGDLQVVSDHRTILLPLVCVVGRPVGMEALVDEGHRRVRVGEPLDDQGGCLLEDVEADPEQVLECRAHPALRQRIERQDYVDQVRRDMISDGVPVLAGTVVAKGGGVGTHCYRIKVRVITAGSGEVVPSLPSLALLRLIYRVPVVVSEGVYAPADVL